MFNLSEAKKTKAKLRLAIDGASGSGKTYSALLIAYGITGDWSKIAVIDTERESANLYEGLCKGGKKYLTGQINAPFTPQKYLEAIHACEESDIEVAIIDSLTHAWTAEGGLLDIHEAAVKKQKTQNTYTAWADVTPLHRKLVDCILTSPLHIISTVRSKTDYEISTNDYGKKEVVKVGMKPIFREGLDYEMTMVFSLSQDHMAKVSKSRIDAFPVNDLLIPTIETGKKLIEWLNTGAEIPVCGNCGKDISEVKGIGNSMVVALYTERKYGKKLCAECAKKEAEIDYGEKTLKNDKTTTQKLDEIINSEDKQ